MTETINAVRGMNDMLPRQTAKWQRLEALARQVIHGYGYREIRFPIVEKTALFERSIGAATDIVEKEMYTFVDRGGDSLTLRPEGTAGCVRAGLQHGLFHNQIQRLWYMGPMFRRERPQKGRYRQFHQIGIEAFGLSGPEVDAELILMTARLWRTLGLSDLRLELNTLGTAQGRAHYREDLVSYFSKCEASLDEDSQRRLQRNPLRILDSKNPAMQAIIAEAPTFAQYLDEESREHFDGLQDILTKNGVDFVVNPRLVRGLDYYSRTVFEWITTQLGAQGTVCGGGRYDGLVAHFGGQPTGAVGCAMGLERLVELMVHEEDGAGPYASTHAYMIAVGEQAVRRAMCLGESLRGEIPQLRLLVDCGQGSFKSQFKRADKSGAIVALVLGEDELANQTVTIKALRRSLDQVAVDQDALGERMREILVQHGIDLAMEQNG